MSKNGKFKPAVANRPPAQTSFAKPEKAQENLLAKAESLGEGAATSRDTVTPVVETLESAVQRLVENSVDKDIVVEEVKQQLETMLPKPTATVNLESNTPENIAAGNVVIDIVIPAGVLNGTAADAYAWGEKAAQPVGSKLEEVATQEVPEMSMQTLARKGCQRGNECKHGTCFYDGSGHRCEV